MRRAEIDEAILSHVNATWQKLALVIVKVANKNSLLFADEENDFEVIAQHIELLVGEGRLRAQGNLRNWRSSEICKPFGAQ